MTLDMERWSFPKIIQAHRIILTLLSAVIFSSCAIVSTQERYVATGDVGKKFDGVTYVDTSYHFFQGKTYVMLESHISAYHPHTYGPFFLPIIPATWVGQKNRDWDETKNISLTLDVGSGSSKTPVDVDLSQLKIKVDDKEFPPESTEEDKRISNRCAGCEHKIELVFANKASAKSYKINGIKIRDANGSYDLPEWEFDRTASLDMSLDIHK